MKKRILSLALAICLCLGLSVPAWAAGPTFTDVPTGHWAYAQIERAYSEGVIAGTYYDESTGERRFSPDEPMTMAQLVTILCRKFFPDEMETAQATGPWYAQAQEVALKHHLYGWTTEGTNGMDKPLNRYGMAQILYATLLAIGCAPTDEDMAGVSEQIADYDEIKSPTPIVGVVSLGIISGVDEKGTFAGDAYMTRAQAAVVFCRLVDVTEEKREYLEDSGTFQFDAPFDKPYTMQVGEQSRMIAHYYQDGERWGAVVGHVYTSSDPNVVRVVSGDEIEAVGPGTATVTCSAYWFNLPVTTSCQITVEAEQETTEPTEPDEPTVPDEATEPEEPLTENDLEKMRKEMLELVNEERANAGLSALRLNDDVCAYAQIRANEVSSKFSHTRPNGENYWTELERLGIEYNPGGENISAGENNPEDAVIGWMNSPGHRANILKEGIGQIGIGFVKVNSGYHYYWVQIFVP